MSLSAAPIPNADFGGEASGSQDRRALSAMRMEFARQFVLLGGNGTRAAVEAGYSDSDPSKAARRNLCDPKVIAEIKRLSTINIGAWLPTAIGVIIELMHNPETPPKVRLDAAVALLDRAGLSPPKGGVQVNVGVQVNGGEAQALIGSIWEARQKRIGSSSDASSDILPAMTDIAAPHGAGLIDHTSDHDGEPLDLVGDGYGGGDQAERVPSPASIYTSPSPPTIAIPPEIADGVGQPEGDDDDRSTEARSHIRSSRDDVVGDRGGYDSSAGEAARSAGEDGRVAAPDDATAAWRSVAGAVGSGSGRESVGADRDDDGRASDLGQPRKPRTFDYD